jgi:CO/xanthine dehydrogenase Mo-binding subunit
VLGRTKRASKTASYARAVPRRESDPARSGPAEEITFAELGKIAYANQALMPKGFEGGLEATYYHSHPHADPLMLPDMQGRVRAQYTFSSAAHAAVVEVDRETGRVRVLRYVIVSDNGTLINPSVWTARFTARRRTGSPWRLARASCTAPTASS